MGNGRADARWLFLAVCVAGTLALGAGLHYFGDLLRGTDADYPYALAHSVVFDRDVDITNNLPLGGNPHYLDPAGDESFARVPRRPDGGFRTKLPIGISLVEVPLIAGAHVTRRALAAGGLAVDGPPGYSTLELFLVGTGLVGVIAFGLALAFRLATEAFGRWSAAVGVAGCWLGTSLFYYTSVQPFWSHGVSFTALVIVLWVVKGLSGAGRINHLLVGLGAAMGFVYLVRPQQVLIGLFLIPLLLTIVRSRRAADWLPGAAAGIALSGVAVALQTLMNYTQFGVLALNAYRASGQRFVVPFNEVRGDVGFVNRLGIVLFEHDRGLLVYSPVVVLAVVGFVWFRRRMPTYVWPFVANAAAQILLIAMWYPRQGESFGARMWSDTSAVVVFGLAAVIAAAAPRQHAALVVMVGMAIAWTCYLVAWSIGVV